MAETGAALAGPAATDPAPEAGGSAAGFLRLSVVAYVGLVAVLTAAVLVYLRGHLVYVLDDPAIHLSIADNLVRHGTWGVAAGAFESASSSPLWTLLIAPAALAPAPLRDWAPLALNVVAGLAVLALLARNQTVLRPGRGRPLDVVAALVLTVVVLFLPGLAIVGMEHTLHMALVLAAVMLVHRRALGRPDRLPSWSPLALVALATLARLETTFVALGLAAAFLLAGRPAGAGAAGARRAAAVLAASAVPIALVGVANRALGGGWLPNSILAKGQGTATSNQSDGLGPVDIMYRLTGDPLLATMFALAVAYLVLTWGREAPNRLPAVTLAVATVAHVALADVGWYERYQAYLLAVGAYLLLGILAELPEAIRSRALLAATGLALVFGLPKLDLLVDVPRAADDMYRQQYQAARFLDRYYDGVPVGTDQLGYISLLHDGPLTDFAGLGDYEILRAGDADPDRWGEVAERRGTRVVVVYDLAGLSGLTEAWILAGELRIDGEPVTGVTPNLQFYATTEEELGPLQERLAEFGADLPPRVEMRINENAELQLMRRELDRQMAEEMAEAVGDA